MCLGRLGNIYFDFDFDFEQFVSDFQSNLSAY